MKVLLYGGRGWIGNQFKLLMSQQNIEYTLGECRVDNINSLTNEIISVSPTHIVSMIGRTHGSINDKKYETIDYL